MKGSIQYQPRTSKEWQLPLADLIMLDMKKKKKSFTVFDLMKKYGFSQRHCTQVLFELYHAGILTRTQRNRVLIYAFKK